MVTLIILNIILIILLIFLLIYILGSKKNNLKNDTVNHDNGNHDNGNHDNVNHDYINDNSVCEITVNKNKRKIKNKSDRVFEGRFVSDDEYNQIMKYRRDVSNLWKDVEREYEHLKELNK
jgi:regulatory protein YycI of two-component signal transduction system YycFG